MGSFFGGGGLVSHALLPPPLTFWSLQIQIFSKIWQPRRRKKKESWSSWPSLLWLLSLFFFSQSSWQLSTCRIDFFCIVILSLSLMANLLRIICLIVCTCSALSIFFLQNFPNVSFPNIHLVLHNILLDVIGGRRDQHRFFFLSFGPIHPKEKETSVTSVSTWRFPLSCCNIIPLLKEVVEREKKIAEYCN